MGTKVPIEVMIESVIAALERMHVLGVDSDLHSGALTALRSIRDALKNAKKEAESNENQNRQGKNV